MTCTAVEFRDRLAALRPAGSPSDDYDGIRMGAIFQLAKECMDMAPDEIERLLTSESHALRAGAVAVMDWQARSRRTPPDRRRELFEMYLRRHDRIDTWDLVDRSAIYVVGDHLADKPRDVLYELARSMRPMERRTAILSTFAFMRRGQVDDTFAIAELLVDDPEDAVHKAVGWMLREAGKRDMTRLETFLERHAATMPRVMLRYAIEKMDKPARDRWLGRKSAGRTVRGSGGYAGT